MSAEIYALAGCAGLQVSNVRDVAADVFITAYAAHLKRSNKLALPDWVGSLTRPFIAAYWSWSGVLQTLRGERYYDIVQTVIQTALSPASLCLWVLCSHVIIGLFIAWLGCQRQRMD